MYVINEWLERYEVNDKGQPAREGDKLRVRPLDYIRAKCHGKRRSAGFAALQEKTGDKAFEVFGLFIKFTEIAGDDIGGKRGNLLNARGNPASPKDIAQMLSFPLEKIEYALEVLTSDEIYWMQHIPEFPGKSGDKNDESEVFQNFQENQEIPGKSGKKSPQNDVNNDKSKTCSKNKGKFQNFQENQERYITEPNRTEPNETKHNRMSPGKSGNSQDIHNDQGDGDFGLGNFNSASFRFRLVTALEDLLKAKSSSDRKSLQNLVNWLFTQIMSQRFDEGVFRQVVDIAKDCQNGSRKPMAVFYKNMDERLGYRAKAAKQLREIDGK